MIRKTIFSISLLSVLMAVSCKKDDDNNKKITPPRDVTEVRDENEASIVSYLKTHFYKFENNEVILDTIAGKNAKEASLFEKVKSIELDVYDANNNKVRHKLYYLPVQEGNGQKSTVADSVFITYKGQLLNGKEFDRTIGYTKSNWWDLLGTRSERNNGSVMGFREAVSLLKDSKSGVIPNTDGTLNVPKDGGVGVFFLPSGVAYFSSATSKIPAYSPLIFTIHLIKTKNADHDGDSIPSIKEIKRDDYGIVTLPDCDKDGIPDYLDKDKCK
ncbi:FKBP-type peptidyl-prolyl cis-trans isomerase [Capnocytophaga cynodegmi]|uniref:FKBP-type peptidyl-prolyl cis-trans isomerase n=1 Tax=Capnocytophaga cynodegmi TaxID=28189 RepID=UPI001BB441FF|nr:peptidylprolyl isomerase [Capnocytophaga cynodegmi]